MRDIWPGTSALDYEIWVVIKPQVVYNLHIKWIAKCSTGRKRTVCIALAISTIPNLKVWSKEIGIF